ncbi:MAG: ABC transporter ATP-binding protein [Bacteroidota bacterium]
MLLDVQALSVHVPLYGSSIELLHDVTFSLTSGEVFVLVGESGSGKTTLARALTSLFPSGLGASIHGRVEFDGSDLLRIEPRSLRQLRRKEIRYIFQEPGVALNPAFRLRAQTRFLTAQGRKGHNSAGTVREHSFHQSLLAMGVTDPAEALDSYPHQLSVGTLQRMLIAAAIAPHPRFLIADEPTSAVDAVLRYQILDLLVSICRNEAMTLLLITHDLEIARRYGDRIAALYAGRILEISRKDEYLHNPLHPYSQMLLRALPTPTSSLDSMPSSSGSVPSFMELPKGCKFHPRCYKVQADCRKLEPELISTDNHRKVRCPYWK